MNLDRFRPQPPTDDDQVIKRPWQRPRILFREPLETLATVCQPSPPAKAIRVICRNGPISS